MADVAIVAINNGILSIAPAAGGTAAQVPGVSWSLTAAPTLQTRIQRAVSGRELRIADYPYPLRQYALTFEVLRSGAPFYEFEAITALIVSCQGAAGTFLWQDPDDNVVTGQIIGTTDGTTTVYQLVRTWGSPLGGVSFTEPITGAPHGLTVYLSSGPEPPAPVGGWDVDPTTGLLTFSSAPPAGMQITATFSYYFRARFMSDAYSFEQFMFRLWSAKKIDFITAIN